MEWRHFEFLVNDILYQLIVLESKRIDILCFTESQISEARSCSGIYLNKPVYKVYNAYGIRVIYLLLLQIKEYVRRVK